MTTEKRSEKLSLDLIEEFVDLVAIRNMSALASRQGKQKSGISRRLAQLERTVGQPLVIRKRRDLTATDAGRELRNRVEVLLREIRKQIDEFQNEFGSNELGAELSRESHADLT